MSDFDIAQPVSRQLLHRGKEADMQFKPIAAAMTSLVHREMMHEEDEKHIQTKLSLPRAEQRGALESNDLLETHLTSTSMGSPLPHEVRVFMEPRFEADFSQVRVHTDSRSVQMNRALNAQAFTHRQNLYFSAGKSAGNDALTAHELAHVLQQTGGARSKEAAQVPGIQREVQVRPPGRGEASAFDRRQELIDRLNGQSPAIQYRLDGRELLYDVINEAALTNFDRQMRAFIDRPEVVPMRLITRSGLVGGGPLEEIRPNGTLVFAFRSDEGYRVFHVFRGAGQAEQSGDLFVRTRDRRRLTIDQLRAERAAAAAAPAPALP